jgi:excinuclease ABC subunit C
VFTDGVQTKAEYRRYRIREAAGGDDYDCLREVMRRRLARIASEPLPDLLMVDGGRGQLGVVTAALADAGLEVDTVGISKERDDSSPSKRVKRSGGLKAERLYRPGRANPILLSPSSRGLLFLQRVRDESHRFAIEFQRELRSKVGLTSILEELPGIGPGKRRALLRTLGSLRAVKEASEETLRGVSGISERDAALIRRFFDSALARPESEPLPEPLRQSLPESEPESEPEREPDLEAASPSESVSEAGPTSGDGSATGTAHASSVQVAKRTDGEGGSAAG